MNPLQALGTHRRNLIVAACALGSLAMGDLLFAKARSANRSRQVASAAPAKVSDGESTQKTIEDAIAFARESDEQLESVKDYTAVFTKTEQVGDHKVEQAMDIKVRHQPFSVYLHFRAGKEAGREVIYVEGANNGCLVVHETGLLGSLAGTQVIKLDDATVKAENRYPITEIGVAKIVDKSLEIWQGEQKAHPKNTNVRFVSNAKFKAVSCDVVEVEHSKEAKSEFSRSRVFFDHESKFPIRVERYGWPEKNGGKSELVEMYDYEELKVNVGLTDADFDPKNPQYGFGGKSR